MSAQRKAVPLSKFPPTQRPIVEALLDGIVVSYSTNRRSDSVHVFCPRAQSRNEGLGQRTAGTALFALHKKGVVRDREPAKGQPFWRHDVELVPGSILDDRDARSADSTSAAAGVPEVPRG